MGNLPMWLDGLVSSPDVFAPCLGLTVAIGTTQWIKFYWPLTWRERVRSFASIACASVLAGTVTLLVNHSPLGIAETIVVMVLAPTAYFVGVRLIGLWRPDIRARLSGDLP